MKPSSAVLLAGASLCALGHAEDRPRKGQIVRWEHGKNQSVLVPAGPFTMGYVVTAEENDFAKKECLDEVGRLDPDDCEVEAGEPFRYFANATPGRTVDMHAFEIDRYEVRVGDFRKCVARGRCDVSALLIGDTRYLEEEWPMVNVTWQDAVDYCKSVGKRLPTEAEWEKAARGKDGRRWPWGNEASHRAANHGKAEDEAVAYTHSFVPAARRYDLIVEWVADGSDGAAYAAPPGSFPGGKSPYGVMDMAGNVSEWVQDYFWPGQAEGPLGTESGGYADLPTVSPVRAAPRERILYRSVRGGSWLLPLIFARTYVRQFAPPDARSAMRGFRCARDHRTAGRQ